MTWMSVLPSGGMATARKKRSEKPDENQVAASVLSHLVSQSETPPAPTPDEVSRVMAALGRRGGKKGGPARKAALSKEQRRQIASKAAKARWKGSK